MPDRPPSSSCLARSCYSSVAVFGVTAAALLLVLVADPASAQPQPQMAPLDSVITRLQQVIVGLAAGLATLFLTIGGLRYVFAGGDPSQVEKAKLTLRSAAIGYGIAALAGTLFALLRYIVSG